MLIAWYRIDWAVQDLADFARGSSSTPQPGRPTRARALALVESTSSTPGGEVDDGDRRRRRAPRG